MQVRSCQRCGHQYVAGLPNEPERRRRLEEFEASLPETQRQLKELRRVLVDRRTGLLRVQHDISTLRGPCTIVDASASSAGMLWAAQFNGYTVHGLERSAKLRGLARQYHGINLEDGDLFENRVRSHSADLLVLSHDLDEAPDPRALLTAALRVAPRMVFFLWSATTQNASTTPRTSSTRTGPSSPAPTVSAAQKSPGSSSKAASTCSTSTAPPRTSSSRSEHPDDPQRLHHHP